MSIERLQRCIRNSSGGRLRVLYGPAIEDSFISTAFREMNIEEALQEELTVEGFDRIVFCSPHRPLYQLENTEQSRSEEEWDIPAAVSSGNFSETNAMRILTGGPFENMVLMKHPSVNYPVVEEFMGDLHAIRILDRLMRIQDYRRTAVIFVQAETTLKYFDDARTLAGLVGEWLRLPSYNHNVCFFLFSAIDYEELNHAAETIPVPELRSQILRYRGQEALGDSLFRLNGPHREEILRMFQYIKAQYGVHIEDKGAYSLAEWMSVEGGRLNSWMARLLEAESIDLEYARRSGWFAGVRTEQAGALQCLDNLVGLQEIKRRIRELRAWLEYRQEQSEQGNGDSSSAPLHHLVFTGNPGTGKTTIARLVGEIYREMGILKRGHVVEVKGGDLVSDHVGGTAIQTNRIIDKAIDGILFIDEAHVLAEEQRGGFGREALDTLLTRMEDEREQLVVIIAGYPQKIHHLLKTNPGLPRRFPWENIFNFPDYSPVELMSILKNFLVSRRIPMVAETEACLETIIRVMYRQRDVYFGNAGEMRNLVDALERKRAVRIRTDGLSLQEELRPEDIPERYLSYYTESTEYEEPFRNLEEIIGWSPLKETLRKMAICRREPFFSKEDSTVNSLEYRCLLFTGPAGCGKTTAARMMGKVLKCMKLLSSDDVIEITWGKLLSYPLNGYGAELQEKIHQARGGILLIDDIKFNTREIWQENAVESVRLLVKAIEDSANPPFVIFTGRTDAVNLFLERYPQIKMCIDEVVPFFEVSIEELVAIFQRMSMEQNIILTEEIMDAVRMYLETLRTSSLEEYSAMRSLRQLFRRMKNHMLERVIGQAAKQGGQPLSSAPTLCFQLDDIPFIGEIADTIPLALPACT